MTSSVIGVLRPTFAYYFPIVFFASAILGHIYGMSLWLPDMPSTVVNVLLSVIGLVLGAVLLVAYLRYARTVELTRTALRWQAPYRSGEILIARLTGVRGVFWKQAVIVSSQDAPDLIISPSRGAAVLVATLHDLRPDIPVEGNFERGMWVNVSTHKFKFKP